MFHDLINLKGLRRLLRLFLQYISFNINIFGVYFPSINQNFLKISTILVKCDIKNFKSF